MKTVLKWIFGIGCILFGLLSLTISLVAGILFIIAGAFLIPPIFEKINSKVKINRTLKIIVPIVAVFVAFIIGGIANSNEVETAMEKIEERQKSLSKEKQPKKENDKVAEKETNEVRQKINDENVRVFNANGKEVSDNKKVVWSNNLNKKDIVGDWMQIQYYNNKENIGVTNIKDKDSEQKQLTFTNSKYLTSYPFGSGENSPWNYKLSGNYLSVQTANTKQEIYGFTVKLSDDKSKLLLKEKSGLVQIFRKK